jgi:hypothetical protein
MHFCIIEKVSIFEIKKVMRPFTYYILIFIAIMLLGCDSNVNLSDEGKDSVGQVLLLQVDYTTNEFEGGKELRILKKSKELIIIHEYIEPSDFGSIKLMYLSEPLFEGTIHWMGTGKMTYPEKLEPASYFHVANTFDYIYPVKGFEPIIIPDIYNFEEKDYLEVWSKVQHLKLTREYLKADPNQKVNIFLYTPSVGAGDQLTWKWIIFLKK